MHIFPLILRCDRRLYDRPYFNLLRQTESIVKHGGFPINQSKTRILLQSRQQEVTGIVVNDRLSIDRKTLKRFRATLYQIEKDGIIGKTWGHTNHDLMSALKGFANFIAMVNPEKGAIFLAQIDRINQLAPSASLKS